MTCGPLAARSTRRRTTRTRSPTANCSRRDCSRLGMRASALPRSKITSIGSRRLTVALRTSPARWLYSLKTVSRSASRTFWKMTCLAIWAAMRPSGGVLVEAQFAADLDLGGELAGLFEGHLVDLVFDLFGTFDDRLENIGADLASFAVHLGAHVFLRLVVLAR